MNYTKYTYYLSSVIKLLTGMNPRLQVIVAFMNRSSSKLRTVKLLGSDLRFITRGVMDIWSIKETFLDRFYEKYGTKIGEGWTVIDIGGGIGDFTIYVASKHPKNVVYTFEPTPQSFRILQENLALNNIENVKAYPQAIWSHNGEVKINTSKGDPGQYTSHGLDKDSPKNGELLVPSVTLEQVFELTGLARCNLLKIDCEGAEFEILFNTPDAIFNRIERIVLEYHDNATNYTHHELAKYLTQKGFAVDAHPNYVHSYLGYIFASR